MLSRELFQELRGSLQDRRIQAGIALLEQHKADFAAVTPEQCLGGLALGCLAQWLDVGFDCEDLLLTLLDRFQRKSRHTLPITDYIHLRLAEGVIAMRREDLAEAVRHLDAALMVNEEIEESETVAMARFWKARCLRKAGEYDQALEITQRGRDLARSTGLHYVAAVIQTLESWLLFQKSKTKEALRLLQEAEAVLRHTDDFITLGNIQSTYGRIALREGRYDHAMQYFEASIDLFKRRASLDRYLARSLTNIAQAKRFLALQLRRSIDANWERQRGAKPAERPETHQKTAQLERMHELLRNAQVDLAQADAIYKRAQNHHGAGNVDVNLAQVHLDLGDLHRAEEKAGEAFELGATKTDYLLMCRARIVQAMVANARFEEQIGESDDPSRFAQLAHDCASDAVDLAQHTESRRLTAQAYICHGTTLVNGFFNNTESARACCDHAEAYLDGDRHDALWQELAILRARILHSGIEDPNLRAWSQGVVGDKSLQKVVSEFEELLIRRVWEREDRKISRVAHRLAVSPKKVRRVLRHLGLLEEQSR
jgi:tetratricopeptide (TPR) repeat protein